MDQNDRYGKYWCTLDNIGRLWGSYISCLFCSCSYSYSFYFRYLIDKAYHILQVFCDKIKMDDVPGELLWFPSSIQLPVFKGFIKFAMWPSHISVTLFTFVPLRLIDSYSFRLQASTVSSQGHQFLNQFPPFTQSLCPTIQASSLLHLRLMMVHKMKQLMCSTPCLLFWLIISMYWMFLGNR